MRGSTLMLREAWLEFRAGLRSGIVLLTFLALTAYLLITLLNAEYMQRLGATDIPRNAASVIYLMATGFMFFLFFAWAWVFAQPVLRDREALLHEIVLATPNSLQALLWGRFIGASIVGALLGSAALFGFFVSPVWEWMQLLPPGSIFPTPWLPFAFAFGLLIAPLAVGIGALYFIATLYTRSLGGPLATSALMILLWMFAVIVLQGGDINPSLATIMDPSLFSFALAETDTWTPQQKTWGFLPVTPSLQINRILWGIVPLLVLAWTLHRLTRETLVLEGGSPSSVTKRARAEIKPSALKPIDGLTAAMPRPSQQRWSQAFVLETGWQLNQIFRSRAWWAGLAILFSVGLGNTFVHIIWHAEGPMVPNPGMLLPLLNESVFLVIVFVVAGLTGLICRRDHVLGLDTMFDVAIAPYWLRLFARAVTVIVVAAILSLVPSLSALIATVLVAPQYLDIVFYLNFQLLLIAPSQIEMALIVLLVHTLIRRTGLAYAMSMFVIFILIVNHELELVTYPPLEVGIPGRTNFSPLTGWAPWAGYLLTLDVFKLALGGLVVAAAGVLLPRGFDSRLQHGFRQVRARIAGPSGVLAVLAVVALVGTGLLLQNQLIEEGGYQVAQAERAEDAAWEKRWFPDETNSSSFSVEGGDLRLTIDRETRAINGHWRLRQVIAREGYLHADLPHGLEVTKASVGGHEAETQAQYDHMAIPLGDCATRGCDVTLNWSVRWKGWSAAGDASWSTPTGHWLRAEDVAPRLGLNSDRLLRGAATRQDFGLDGEMRLPEAQAATASHAIAPAGDWRWQVGFLENSQEVDILGNPAGSTNAPLDFAALWGTQVKSSRSGDIQIAHARQNAGQINGVAMDTSDMQACVSRRLGTPITVNQVLQWPRGLGATAVSGDTLQLAEDPHWDIADRGVGRWLRRAEIAKALARRQLVDMTDLRSTSGALWVSEGVAGAIGVLCVADTDGLDAFAKILTRYSEAATTALALSEVPVGALAAAESDSWVTDYAPLATLDWAAQQTPDTLKALLAEIKSRQDIHSVLASRTGQVTADNMLGKPLASSLNLVTENNLIHVNGTRWAWRDGGWHELEATPQYRILSSVNGVVRPTETIAGPISAERLKAAPLLLLDEWQSYERAPTLIGGE